MKLTKLIKEFVEEEVSKVYNAKVNPYTEQAKSDREKIEALKVTIRSRQKETIDSFMAEMPLYDKDSRNNVCPFTYSTSVPSFYHAKTQAMIDEEMWIVNNNTAKREKIREIFINLELGSNRQDLLDMIAKLKEDA